LAGSTRKRTNGRDGFASAGIADAETNGRIYISPAPPPGQVAPYHAATCSTGPAADHGRRCNLVTLRAPVDREQNSQLSPMPHRSVGGSSSQTAFSLAAACLLCSVCSRLRSGLFRPHLVRCIYKYPLLRGEGLSRDAKPRRDPDRRLLLR
jgi:hypothetical protein